MKTSYRVVVLAITMILVAVSAFARDPGNEQARAVIVEGNKETLVGVLELEGPVLLVNTSARTYAIRMGNRPFVSSLGLDLEEENEIAVFGYVNGDVVIPIIVVSEGNAYFLRDTEGTPLWSNARSRPTA